MSAAPDCGLCGGRRSAAVGGLDRPYWHCPDCDLIHLDPSHPLSPAEEKAEYDRHQNDPDDPGYRQFLSRSFREVQQRCPPPATGLDFGCGPGPALIAMAREAGYTMDGHDPHYAPDPGVWTRRYHFITCTEVAEHLATPGDTLTRLWQQLHPGGLLVIQTQRHLGLSRFGPWRYRADPTHISFFSARSFEWLAEKLGAALTLGERDVAVLERG